MLSTGFIVIFLVAPSLASITNDLCTEQLIFDQITACRRAFNMPPWILSRALCENLECYLSCIDDVLSTCGDLPLFHVHDVRIRRVQARYFCSRLNFHLSATELCTVFYLATVPYCWDLISVLDQRSHELYNQGDLNSYMELSCTLYELKRNCSVVYAQECQGDLGTYSIVQNKIRNSPAACVVQNHPLFIQFGHAPVCVNNVTADEVNVGLTEGFNVSVAFYRPAHAECLNARIWDASNYCGIYHNDESLIYLLKFCQNLECVLFCVEEILKYCLYWYPDLLKFITSMRVTNRLMCEAPAMFKISISHCDREPCLVEYMKQLRRANIMNYSVFYDSLCSDVYPALIKCGKMFSPNAKCPPENAEFASKVFLVKYNYCLTEWLTRYPDQAVENADPDSCSAMLLSGACKVGVYFGFTAMLACAYCALKGVFV